MCITGERITELMRRKARKMEQVMQEQHNMELSVVCVDKMVLNNDFVSHCGIVELLN